MLCLMLISCNGLCITLYVKSAAFAIRDDSKTFGELRCIDRSILPETVAEVRVEGEICFSAVALISRVKLRDILPRLSVLRYSRLEILL